MVPAVSGVRGGVRKWIVLSHGSDKLFVRCSCDERKGWSGRMDGWSKE